MSYSLGTAVGKIVIDGSGATKGFSTASIAAQAFFNVIDSKIDSVRRLGDNLVKIGASGSVGLGGAIKVAANFEQALSNIKAVSGATSKEMDGVRDAALRIGKDTVFSASEAAGAMEELIKAGVSTKDVINGAADATVGLAAAGGVDLAEAASIAANALNQFNLKGKDMSHVADLIAGAANASAIDVHDFGYSLSQAGAVAALSGVSFDDLSVAIAEMGKAGIKGSDAGTSIKTFLTNLQPVTSQQTALFRELGLVQLKTTESSKVLAQHGIKPLGNSYSEVVRSLQRYIEANGGAKEGTADNANAAQKLGLKIGVLGNQFFDAKGNVKDFADIQGVLATALKGQTREQKLATLETLFGSDAIRAAAVFADQGAQGFNNLAAEMGKVKAADVARTRLDNLNGSFEQLKGSIETALITIGSYFLPVVRKVVDGITTMVNAFNNLPPGVQKAIAIFVGLGSVMSLFAGIAIKLTFILVPLLARMLGFAALRSVFSIFSTGFAAFRAGAGFVGSLGAAFARAGAVLTRFISIGRFLFTVLSRIPGVIRLIQFAFGPWGIAIALVAAGVILLYKNFEPFRNLVNDVAKIIQGYFVTALNNAKAGIATFIDAFKNGSSNLSGFMGFLQDAGNVAHFLWEALKGLGEVFMQDVVPALKEAGGQILSGLVTAWKGLAATFQSSVLPALKSMIPSLISAGQSLKKLYVTLAPVIKLALQIAAVIAGVLVVAVLALARVILFLLPYIIQIIAFLIKWAAILTGGFISAIVAAVGAILDFANGIIKAVGPAIDVVTGILQGFIDIVVGIFDILKGIVTGSWQDVWNGVVSIVKGIGTAIVAVFTGIPKAIYNILAGFVTGVVNFFKNLFDILVGHSIVPDMINAIVMWFIGLPGKVVAALAGFVVSVVKFFVDLAVKAIQALVSGFAPLAGLLGGIFDIVKGVVSTAVSVIVGIVKGIGTVISAVWSGIAAVTSSVWNGILAVSSAVWGAIKAVIGAEINGVKVVVGAVVNGIVAVVTGAWNAIKAVTSAVWNGIKAVTSTVWNGIKTVVGGAVGGIKSAVSTGVSFVATTVSTAWSGIKSATSTAWNATKGFVSSAWSGIKSAASTGGSFVKSTVSTAWNGVKTITNSTWTKDFVNSVKTGISNVIGFVKGLPGQIVGALGNLGGLLVGAGKSLINGFISGIKGAVGGVKDALGGLTNSLTSWKGPESLDKKILTPNGKMVIAGFVRGLQKEIPEVRKILGNVTDMLPRQINVGVSGNNPQGSAAGKITDAIRSTAVLSGQPLSSGTTVYNNWQVYNPVAEKSSVTVSREATRRAQLGVLA